MKYIPLEKYAKIKKMSRKKWSKSLHYSWKEEY